MTTLYINFELDVQCPECGENFDPNKWGGTIDLLALLSPNVNIPEFTCPHCDHNFTPEDLDVSALN